MKLIVLALSGAFFYFFYYSTAAFSQMPAHSHKKNLGTGWECDRGYFRSGEECREVIAPQNAHINILGDGWECDRGYFLSGEKCEKVVVPKNAHISLLGNDWECDRGYYRSGEQCAKVVVPKNAHIDFLGNNWECDCGYIRSGNECRLMTSAEIDKQKKIEEALKKKLEERKSKGVTGDHCETEYDTGAEVCVKVTNTNLDCSESYTGSCYDDCEVTIYYELSTDYRGGSSLDVNVRCEAEIEYTGRNTYGWRTESEYRDESHSLSAYESNSDSMTLDFSFGLYDEVIKVRIDSVSCEIDSVDLY